MEENKWLRLRKKEKDERKTQRVAEEEMERTEAKRWTIKGGQRAG